MPQFAPSQVTFNDNPKGYGAWDMGHGREHIQFVQVLAARTPAILLPDPDFLAILSGGYTRDQSMQTHQTVHELLREITGVGGVDYTDFKLDQENDFYSFVSYHEQEHQQIRAALGIVS